MDPLVQLRQKQTKLNRRYGDNSNNRLKNMALQRI